MARVAHGYGDAVGYEGDEPLCVGNGDVNAVALVQREADDAPVRRGGLEEGHLSASHEHPVRLEWPDNLIVTHTLPAFVLIGRFAKRPKIHKLACRPARALIGPRHLDPQLAKVMRSDYMSRCSPPKDGHPLQAAS